MISGAFLADMAYDADRPVSTLTQRGIQHTRHDRVIGSPLGAVLSAAAASGTACAGIRATG
ncbi:hypothetical protein GCM10023157_12270 [Gluconacetobacter asukensis]